MGAANEVHISSNDFNIMTVTLKALNCWRNFELYLTVFGCDDNDTYVTYYTHIILAYRFTKLN